MRVVGRQIHVRDRVQGVGFRPFVWRLAREAGLTGRVRNDGAGVCIDIWGSETDLDSFLDRLQRDPPPLARIETAMWSMLDTTAPDAPFRIASSQGGTVSTEIAPDAATCDMRHATRVWLKSAIRKIDGVAIPSPTAPIAGRDCPSSRRSPMTARRPRCAPSRCATTAAANTTIPPTAAFTHSPMPAPPAAPGSGSRTEAVRLTATIR